MIKTSAGKIRRAPFIKPGDGKAPLAHLFNDDRGDQISADDEKDINADKAATKRRETRMEQHNGQNGNRTQAVYFAPVIQTRPF